MRHNRPFDYVSVLSALAILAAAIRLWGIGFGLPLTGARPDESLIADTAVHILQGQFNPGFFNYPSLFLYADAAAQGLYCEAAVVGGRFSDEQQCARSWPHAWAPFFLAGRLLSLVCGVLAIPLVFAIARRLGAGDGLVEGLTAAATLAFAFLHVRDSHFGVTDVAMTTLVLAGVWTLLRASERPAAVRFAMAGAVAGLATSTKYNAAILAVPAFAAAVPARPRMTWGIVSLALFGVCALVAFVVTSPFAVIDRAKFAADLAFEARHLAAGHGVAAGRGWYHHAVVTLPLAVGWPLFLCGVAGMAAALVRARRVALIVFAFPIGYYVVAGRGYTVFARYMVPVVPFLCVGCGALAGEIRSRLAVRRPALANACVAAVVVIGIAPNAVKDVGLDRLLARTDSRVLAAEWIASHVAAGSSVDVSGSDWGRPDLWREGTPPPFGVTVNPSVDQLTGEWLIVQESPLVQYNGPLTPASVPASYSLRQVIRAYNPAVRHVYDQQDAFFLPLDGFEGIGRPGPTFYIYERRGEK